jgi:hypothetical protein
MEFKININNTECTFTGSESQYIISNTDYIDGTYVDTFTSMDNESNQLIQIRVIKEVLLNTMSVTIRYSTEEELINYLNEINNEENNEE